MLLKLFNIFIRTILDYNKAKCLPIQVLDPALNPTTAYGSRLSHSPESHLSGRNYKGFLKNFYE